MRSLKHNFRRAALLGLSPFDPALEDSLLGIRPTGALLADFPFNIGLGRVVQWYINVQTNSPANAALVLAIIETATADATLRDLDTLEDVLADAGTAEVTNTNYARKVLTDSDLSVFAPDDANDRADLDIPDQSFTGIGAGDDWSDAVIGYDEDSTAGDDGDILMASQHDLGITPDGSDIDLVPAATGFYRSAAA